jgi:hypothetical protein
MDTVNVEGQVNGASTDESMRRQSRFSLSRHHNWYLQGGTELHSAETFAPNGTSRGART